MFANLNHSDYVRVFSYYPLDMFCNRTSLNITEIRLSKSIDEFVVLSRSVVPISSIIRMM